MKGGVKVGTKVWGLSSGKKGVAQNENEDDLAGSGSGQGPFHLGRFYNSSVLGSVLMSGNS